MWKGLNILKIFLVTLIPVVTLFERCHSKNSPSWIPQQMEIEIDWMTTVGILCSDHTFEMTYTRSPPHRQRNIQRCFSKLSYEMRNLANLCQPNLCPFRRYTVV